MSKKRLRKVIVKIGIRMKRNTRQRNAYTHVHNQLNSISFSIIFNKFMERRTKKSIE